jgi:5-enolpyruvylshikimate-3-phosphate synthase
MIMDDIMKRTGEYAESRTVLAGRVQRLNDEIEAAKRKLLPGIKKAVEVAAEKKAALKNAIEEGAGLFVKPRTVVLYGVKVGLEKGKGKIDWEDDDQVVKLIKRHYADQADVLIKTTEKPIKKALSALSVAELKKLGVTVEETGDQVIIKGTDSDVDKLVKALLREHENEECEEAA